MTLGTRRRWVLWTAAVLGVVVTARLGLWQLDRAQQKIDRQQRLEERGQLPLLPAASLARDASQAADQFQRRTVLQGRWVVEHTVYLDNRQMDGRPGFFVVTPLLLPDGDAVLVQRGWIPRDFQDRTRLQPVATLAGPVQVAGRIAPPPGKLFDFDGVESGPIRQNLEPVGFAREIRLALRPLSLVQTEPETPAALDGLPAAQVPPSAGSAPTALARRWASPVADVGKHHGYAFQWFALCALIAGLTLWFQIIRPRVQQRSPHAD